MMEEESLTQKIIGTQLSTASGCADCPNTPYLQQMVYANGLSVNTCRYISFDMTEQLKAKTANESVCKYQGDSVLPVFSVGFKGLLKKFLRTGKKANLQPTPRYQCKKFSKRRDSDNRRRMRR